jgi:hypothetical protein
MENFVSNIQKKLTGNSFDTSSDVTSTASHEFRKIQLPQAKIGLGSTEGDLLSLAKGYLEVVGLVVFVWILGKNSSLIILNKNLCLGYYQFSVSWILLAVLIYLFRQRQRTQFKERHKMLNQINNNEEQYIKARLDELPSWVK